MRQQFTIQVTRKEFLTLPMLVRRKALADMARRSTLIKKPHGSCLLCGYDKPYAVFSGYHPGIGVCFGCRDAAQRNKIMEDTVKGKEQ